MATRKSEVATTSDVLVTGQNDITSPTTEDGTTSKKKKKKKPAGSKLERQKKREEEKLKALYGPKDSHVQLISASDLQKLQGVFRQEKLPTKSTVDKPDAKSYDDDFPSFGCQKSNDSFGCQQPNDSIAGPPLKSSEKITLEAVSSKKKSKKPIVISLDDLIIKKTTGKELSKIKVKKRSDDMTKRYSNNVTIGNTLDSSGPLFIHRGKMREKPKKKKPTKLKLAILKSRATKLEQTQVHSENSSPTQENRDDETSSAKKEDDGPSINTEVGDQVFSCTQSSLTVVDCDILKEDGSQRVSINDNTLNKNTLNEQSVEILNEVTAPNENIFVALLDTAIQENNKRLKPSTSETKSEGGEIVADCHETQFSAEIVSKSKESLHSRKFKQYCDMYVSKELHGHVIALLKELHRFQDRLYHSDPIKYKTKRRFIHGIKDTLNSLKINKVVLVIFAPDIESSNAEGGLNEKIEEIKALAKVSNVPVIYSGNRFVLGKPIFCKTAVSVISILDRQGAENLYFKVLEEAKILRDKYEADLSQKIQDLIAHQQ